MLTLSRRGPSSLSQHYFGGRGKLNVKVERWEKIIVIRYNIPHLRQYRRDLEVSPTPSNRIWDKIHENRVRKYKAIARIFAAWVWIKGRLLISCYFREEIMLALHGDYAEYFVWLPRRFVVVKSVQSCACLDYIWVRRESLKMLRTRPKNLCQPAQLGKWENVLTR